MPQTQPSKFTVIGIDGGLKGAISAINDEGQLLQYFDIPTTVVQKKGKGRVKNATVVDGPALLSKMQALSGVLSYYAPHQYWFLELAGARPGEGVSSSFTTGKMFGMLEMACLSLGKPYVVVHPKTWTKWVLAGMDRGAGKERSFAKAIELFPEMVLKKPKGRVNSYDGRADSALIAYYGLMHMNGETVKKKGKKKNTVPTCPNCKEPVIHCKCKDNELKK
jgi:hypothetical protein